MLDQELFDLFEGTADAAFALTDQCEICSWNKAAERLFGYSHAEAIGRAARPSAGRTVLGTKCGVTTAASGLCCETHRHTKL